MKTSENRGIDQSQPSQEHTFRYKIVCVQGHPQPDALITAKSEILAHAAAVRNRIQNRFCDTCGLELRLSLNGRPASIDGQPPEPRITG